MSSMKISSERGEINVLLIPLILVIMALIGAGVFGYWAYSGRQDYKNNVDQKINVAVAAAQQKLSTQKDKQFAEEEKNPLTTYSGPSSYGSLVVKYPKTWSGYVDEEDGTDTPINAYFYPGVVPSASNQNNAFALRVQVLQQSYDSILQQYNSYAQQKLVTVNPYTLPGVKSVVGVRVEGQIQPQKHGSLVILPVRNQTLEIWTEASQFSSDFNNIILPNFTFSP